MIVKAGIIIGSEYPCPSSLEWKAGGHLKGSLFYKQEVRQGSECNEVVQRSAS